MQAANFELDMWLWDHRIVMTASDKAIALILALKSNSADPAAVLSKVALAFQRLWHFYIVEHHNSEDHVFWPWMHHNVPALKPTLDALEPEHQALFDLHDNIEHILKTPTSNVTCADVDSLEELLKHLKSFLQQHFQKEEETICSTLAYSLSREQQDDLKRVMKEAGRQSPHAKDRLCAYADLAASDANVREKFEAKFPWILRWVLIPLLWTPKYRQAELVFVP